MTGVSYPAVRVEGALLAGGLLTRVGDADASLPAMEPASYGLQSGESIRRYANRSFSYLRDQWRDYAAARAKAGEAGTSARLARERWLLVLLRELGYTDLAAAPGGLTVDERTFAVSHTAGTVPVHLLGWGVGLDHRTPGVRGAAGAAPHSMVQQLLNHSTDHLWAVVANAGRLRLLRDSTSLVGSAYVEFDLEAIFDGELFPDFVLLYRLAHAKRLRPATDGDQASIPLEQWRAEGARQGERALGQLRDGVHSALEILGTGFLTHPANTALRASVEDATLVLPDVQRSLLRLIYRLLFWCVAEDRGVLLDPGAAGDARDRYDRYFSARRLRDLAVRRRHSAHHDLYDAVRLVFDRLGAEDGCPDLALPGLGGLFEPGPLDAPLADATLSNTALLEAMEALAVLPARSGAGRQRVDFRHLGAEELGSVYEWLLELHPRWDGTTRRFHAERLAGNERKTTGSYYTPSSLVEALLGSALDPLLDEACTADDPVEALLNLTVCDPACGSGHFLIAAARRIAKRVAAEQTDELEPTPAAIRAAMPTVVARCIYGVDVNEMAAELAKVSLWLEALEPGRALGYLDANIRVGNSLLGTTPKLLRDGIPEDAYKPLTGDDRKVVTALKKQNAKEQEGQGDLFGSARVLAANTALAREAAALVQAEARSLADVHVQARRAQDLEAARADARRVADAWCAAFTQPKTEASRATAITQEALNQLADTASRDLFGNHADGQVAVEASQYRFFHWHVEFPHIFTVPADGAGVDPATGWRGGFTCVLGNPPWERVKLQEQEFFAAHDTHIAGAPNAAARKKRIAALAISDEPRERALFELWQAALRQSDGAAHLLLNSGRYPLTGKGDVNTYAVFAETARTILRPRGQLGMILPTGIATDATTQHFFKDLVTRKSLVSLYDFENEDKVFGNVHHSFRFALLTVGGSARKADRISLVFRVRQANQIAARAYELTPEEITLLNPNTGTCPVFNSRRDAEITLGIYRRVPVLWREGDPDGNPWGLSFMAMIHMANDSGSFRTAEQLDADGWQRDGNHYVRDTERMLPLYEAKMLHHFDHRFSTYEGATQAQLNVGTLPRLDDTAHADPNRLPIPRYWVSQADVNDRIGDRWNRSWLLSWRNIARSSDERTVIASVSPAVGLGNASLVSFPTAGTPSMLQAALSALVVDYVARQKLPGTNFVYMYMRQLPVLAPSCGTKYCAWHTETPLQDWISARVAELSCTAWDLQCYSADLGYLGPPFVWDPARREVMRAELDAAFFHLYGVERDDVDYIMDTFKVLRQNDEKAHGEFRTKRLVLERYDAMAKAMSSGDYQTPLDPPPGRGPRHPAR